MRQLLHATTGPPQPFTPSERAILAEWAQEQTLGAWRSPAGRIGWMMKFGEEARELIDRLYATVQAQEAEIGRVQAHTEALEIALRPLAACRCRRDMDPDAADGPILVQIHGGQGQVTLWDGDVRMARIVLQGHRQQIDEWTTALHAYRAALAPTTQEETP